MLNSLRICFTSMWKNSSVVGLQFLCLHLALSLYVSVGKDLGLILFSLNMISFGLNGLALFWSCLVLLYWTDLLLLHLIKWLKSVYTNCLVKNDCVHAYDLDYTTNDTNDVLHESGFNQIPCLPTT